MYKYVLIILFLSLNALADGEKLMRLQLGMDNSPSLPDVKALSLGYSNSLTYIFDYKIEGGLFTDLTQSQGIIGFGGPSLGLSSKTKSGFYSKIYFGPAFITQTDTRLGGLFEFQTDIEIGLSDYRGIDIGISYKHISDAGITPLNLGRDFLGITLGIP
jgi:hypothetical protein